MTELLDGALEVRGQPEGPPQALRTAAGWRQVMGVAAHWRVEADWWRTPLRRDYWRCLLADGECVDVYRDLDTAAWQWSRRHD